MTTKTRENKMKIPQVGIKKILYATDLSKGAIRVFAHAVDLANSYHASITILHVLFGNRSIDSFAKNYIGPDGWLEVKQKLLNQTREALIGKKRPDIAIREVLQQFSEDLKTRTGAETVATDEIVIEESGYPEDVILEQANRRECDLIVIGNHCAGALSEKLIGSTARRVLQRSTKPVLVIPIPKEPGAEINLHCP